MGRGIGGLKIFGKRKNHLDFLERLRIFVKRKPQHLRMGSFGQSLSFFGQNRKAAAF
jgi:hypothetical protein